MHRANFNTQGIFMVCSEHFQQSNQSAVEKGSDINIHSVSTVLQIYIMKKGKNNLLVYSSYRIHIGVNAVSCNWEKVIDQHK